MKTILSGAALVAVLATGCTRHEPTSPAEGTAAPAATTPSPAATLPAEPAPAPMPAETAPTGDIVAVATGSPDHSTLVSAVQAAGLVDTLKGAGPFTVFAPTNAAFQALPAGTLDTLMKPDKKADLSKLLTYHVVPEALDAAELTRRIEAGKGKAELTTVEGEKLTAKAGASGGITLTDAKGGVATVTAPDLRASNGVVHVIDKVVMPKK